MFKCLYSVQEYRVPKARNLTFCKLIKKLLMAVICCFYYSKVLTIILTVSLHSVVSLYDYK